MIQKYSLLLTLCFITYSLPGLADSKSMTIYKYLDANGVLHLTNKPPKKNEEVLYARSYIVQSYTPPPPPVLPRVNRGMTQNKDRPSPAASEYASLIELAALRNGLPAALLHAVIKVESGYNPNATSPKGAVGLMQLMPGTAKRFGVTDRTNPAENIEGGARYLRELLTMFNQDLSLALAGYNAGENAVLRAGNAIPPYRETRNYVKQVMALYQRNEVGLSNNDWYVTITE